MTDNPQLYNQLAANWPTVVAPGFAGEIHMLSSSYVFAATHRASDLTAYDLTLPSGSLTSTVRTATTGTITVGPFTSNPISVSVPASSVPYRYLVWCMPTSHEPLLCLDLGFARGAPDTAVVTITGQFLVGVP